MKNIVSLFSVYFSVFCFLLFCVFFVFVLYLFYRVFSFLFLSPWLSMRRNIDVRHFSVLFISFCFCFSFLVFQFFPGLFHFSRCVFFIISIRYSVFNVLVFVFMLSCFCFPFLSFLLIFTLMPNFFIAFIAAKTSSDINKFFAFDLPLANEENKTHLMLKLLSPLTLIFFEKLFILLLIVILFDIKN